MKKTKRTFKQILKNQAGISLIELLIITAMLGVVAYTAVPPLYNKYITLSDKSADKMDDLDNLFTTTD